MNATPSTKAATAAAPAPAVKAKPVRKAPVKAAAKAKVAASAKPKAPAKKVVAPAVPAAPLANAATATAAAPAAKAAKPAEPKKTKLVRDSFTIPRAEYQLLQDLKQRAATLGRPSKKSEVLRAGIKTLAALSDAAFTAALAAVPVIKTGRPAKG
ncbi:MAG: hypothetical protein V4505_26835 [Pseudomonadota bacterium]